MSHENERHAYRRSPANESNLPDGVSCGDCVHFERCKRFISARPDDEVCDWIPSRFVLRSTHAKDGGR